MTFHTDALRSASPSPRALPPRAFAGVSPGDGAQAVLLLLVGAVLGPQGLVILNTRAVGLVDPAVTVAVTVIGVVVTSEMVAPRASAWRARLSRSVLATATLVLIAAGLLAVAARVVGTTELARAFLSGVQGCGAALLVSASAVLLLASAKSDTERRVLQIAAILLLGGIADFLSQPAFVIGAIAGAFWRWRGGPTGDAVRQDLAYVERPLFALVLVIAGARVELSLMVWALATLYVFLDALLVRAFGRGTVSSPLVPVALTLDVVRAAGPTFWPIVSIVVVGTIASQILSPLYGPGSDDAVPIGGAE